ncbi:MAG: hypothetical protein WC975_01660 [Phycisphaerae bacterium]
MRVVLSVLAIVIILGILGPTLIPENKVRQLLLDRLAGQTQSVVRVEHVHFGWLSGFELGGLDLKTKQNDSSLHINLIRIPFEPIRFLFGRQLTGVKLDGVTVELAQGSEIPLFSIFNGNTNPPNFPIRRVEISDLAIRLNWPDGYKNNIIFPSTLVVEAQKQTLTFSGDARLDYCADKTSPMIQAGSFSANGQMQIIQQNDQKCFAGTIKSVWKDVNLGALRLEKVEAFDLTKLQGLSGGSLIFKIFPDLHFNWQLDTTFRGLEIQRRGAVKSTRIDPLRLVTTGSHDPVTGNLSLEKLQINSSALEVRSTILARIDDTGLSMNEANVSGGFDGSSVLLLLPAAQNYLGPQSKISGPCRFDFKWNAKAPAYQLKASVKADAVDIGQSEFLSKSAGVPFNWSLDLRAEQSSWPWMTVDRFEFNFANLNVHGSGQLPGLRPADDLVSWLDSIRRLGQIEMIAETSKIEKVGDNIRPLKSIFSTVNLAGPVSFRIEYNGQEDIGRTDVKLELASETSLSYKDWFVKPIGQKAEFFLQTFWPERSDQPQMWCNFTGKCGRGQIANRKPAKLVWAFSKDQNSRFLLDFVSDLSGDIHGLENLISLSPKLKQTGWAKRFGGDADMKMSSAVQLALTDSGWTPRQVRLHTEVGADNTRIDFPEVFYKSSGIPLFGSLDYKFNSDHRRHALDGVLKWQDLVSQLAVTRTSTGGEKGDQISGRYEIQIGDLNKTIAAFPGLSKLLHNHVNADGKLTASCNWSSDSSGDSIQWKIDSTDSGIVFDGRELKLPGIPATFTGGLTLPRPEDGEGPTFKISALESRFGQSFLKLKDQGSFKIRNVSGSKWLKMLGVEPWLAWRTGPIEKLDFDVSGRIAADNSLFAINPSLEQLIQKYGLSGWTDFDVQTIVKNNHLETHISSRLDNLGVIYKNILNKPLGISGVFDLNLDAWTDARDPRIYYCLVDAIRFQLGPIKCAGRGNARIYWSNDKQMKLNDGMVQLNLDPVDLSELSGISGIASRHRTGGQVSARLTLEKENQKDRFGPSFVKFDQASAQLAKQPVMLNGLIHFSGDYCSCDKFEMSAGRSNLQADWQTLFAHGGLNGTVGITTKYTDVEQLKTMLQTTADEFFPSTVSSVPPMPTTQTDLLRQQELMKKLQPLRKIAEKSNLLVSMRADSMDVVDPRSGILNQLSSFLFQLDIGKSEPQNPVTGDLKFWSMVSGGTISGKFTADLTHENPSMVLGSSIDEIRATTAFKPIVENFFPGLYVTGTISIMEDNTTGKMFTTPQTAPNYPVGDGKMVFVDGYLEGRAAPEWITNIFPGLNLTRYSFTRMHNWFSKRASGVVHNNMIFLGQPWNIYIEGNSLPGGRIEYEIGVDLLARYESEYWSSVGQGRIPMFTTTGLIVKGKMENQVIKYVPPHELAYRVFVKNNAITGAYRLLLSHLNKRR